MSDAPPTILRPSRISTEEAARLRAAAWSFVFRCWQEKEKAVEPTPSPTAATEPRFKEIPPMHPVYAAPHVPNERCLITLFDLQRPGAEHRLRRELAGWGLA
jgi:hypothetical protein